MNYIRRGIKRIKGIFGGMKTRCYNVNAKDYYRYGGKGIKICKKWLNDINEFVKWSLNNGYTDELTIDRIDPKGNYCPNNCRWITMKEQINNTTVNHKITINGETKNMSQWAEEYGISREAFWERLKMGWTGEELLKPVRKCDEIEINGTTKTVSEWAKEYNLNPRTIRNRYFKLNWNPEDCLKPPLKKGEKYNRRN